MKADPVLKELWEIKDGLAKECGHDLRRLFDRLACHRPDPRCTLRAADQPTVRRQSPLAPPSCLGRTRSQVRWRSRRILQERLTEYAEEIGFQGSDQAIPPGDNTSAPKETES